MNDDNWLELDGELNGGPTYKLSVYLDEFDVKALNELAEEIDYPKAKIVRLMLRATILKYNMCD